MNSFHMASMLTYVCVLYSSVLTAAESVSVPGIQRAQLSLTFETK